MIFKRCSMLRREWECVPQNTRFVSTSLYNSLGSSLILPKITVHVKFTYMLQISTELNPICWFMVYVRYFLVDFGIYQCTLNVPVFILPEFRSLIRALIVNYCLIIQYKHLPHLASLPHPLSDFKAPY